MHPRERNRRCVVLKRLLNETQRGLGQLTWKFPGDKLESPQMVTSGRFEIERDAKVAYLEYNLAGNVLELVHTEVPEELRGRGLASSLAETALLWARERNFKVDVVCPSVQEYLVKHPEYQDLVLG